jgi:hypothetical protein
MVKTKVKEEEEKKVKHKLVEIDRLFLVSLNVPIKDLKDLDCLGFRQSTRAHYTNYLSKSFDPYG